ncbi:MAG: hypothetical protein RL339_2547 [Pseudomonadota bacterium]|jgi:hypothetical protein
MAMHPAPTRIFLRDDDVGGWTPALARFIACFREHGLPVSYQVIPAQLTDETAQRLRQFHAEQPGLCEFGQHGLAHEMTIGGKRLTWEFGHERDLATQQQVIAAGKAIMQAKLGQAFGGTVFTPPRHRFDGNTVRALHAEGFTVLSAAAYADPLRRLAYGLGRALGLGTIGNRGIAYHPGIRPEAPLREVSIAVAVDDGAPVDRKVSDVLAGIERARRHSNAVGLMFHHQAWDSPQGERFLPNLAQALQALPDCEFVLLSSLAQANA